MKNKLLFTLTLITPLTTQPFLEDASKETLELLVQAAGATAIVLGAWGTAQYVQKSTAQEQNQKLEQQVQYLTRRIDDKNNEKYQLEQQHAQLHTEFEKFKTLAGMSKNDELLRQELWEHKKTFPTLWTILNQSENPNATLNDLIQSAHNLRASTANALNNANAWSHKCSSLESTLTAERSRYQAALQTLQEAKNKAVAERNDARTEAHELRQIFNNSENTIANLHEQIQALHMNLNTARSTHNDSAIAQLQREVYNAQTQANKLQADYNYLHGLYTKLQESNAALTTSYNAAQRERATIQATYDQLRQNTERTKQAEMRGSQASIIETERLKNYVKELQAKIEEQVRTIAQLQEQLKRTQQPSRAVTITEL